MTETKQKTEPQPSTRFRKPVTGGSLRHPANGKQHPPLEDRLARYVRQQEAAGEFEHCAAPTDCVAELKARQKSSRHALRTAAA